MIHTKTAKTLWAIVNNDDEILYNGPISKQKLMIYRSEARAYSVLKCKQLRNYLKKINAKVKKIYG